MHVLCDFRDHVTGLVTKGALEMDAFIGKLGMQVSGWEYYVMSDVVICSLHFIVLLMVFCLHPVLQIQMQVPNCLLCLNIACNIHSL